MSAVRLVAAGDAVLVAEFDERIDPEVNASAIELADALRDAAIPGVRDIVPTFRTVAVFFDPLATDADRLAELMRAVPSAGVSRQTRAGRRIEIPVCYDTDFAIDLEDVARFAGLSAADVVAIHSEVEYRVFMLGFVPGFPYLGRVDARIAAPRRAAPRLQVHAGSVAIAGAQAGIYPRQTPGGWNIIGRTPLSMLSLDRAVPSLLIPGDTVRFQAITRSEFSRLLDEQERRS